MSSVRVNAVLRVIVGVAMVVAPRRVLRVGTGETNGSMVLLMRTIGIRDVVIGGGTLAASGDARPNDVRRWMTVCLVSDALDVAAASMSARHVGRRSACIAATVAVPMVGADVWALSSGLRTVAPEPPDGAERGRGDLAPATAGGGG